MKNLKKVLALVVALTMVFTTVAFASYPDVDAAADYAGAVELLSALDILKGDDNGNFNPDNTITRAEFAAVVCRALGWETSANGAKGTTQFTDVAADHWASGYINLAAQQGIVNGKGNGIFDPEGNVTFTEAVKMLVVAIGYEPMAAQKGGWPTGYLTVANSIRMTAGIPATGTDAAALRSTVAMLTANAIEIPVMDQVSYGTLTEFVPLDGANNYKTLLLSMDIHKVTGVIDEVFEADGEFAFSIKMPPEDYEFHKYDSTGKLVADLTQKRFKIADSNVLDYVGVHVNMYIKEIRKDTDYEAIIVMPSGIGSSLVIGADKLVTGGNATAISSTTSTKTYEYYESKDATRTTKIYVDGNPLVKVNGIQVNPGTFDDNGNVENFIIGDLCNSAWWDGSNFTENVQFEFIENDNDKYYDVINVNIIDYAIVETVMADKERIEFADGSKINFDFDDDQQIVKFFNAEGAEIALEDIQAGDVLALEVGEVSTAGNVVTLINYSVFNDKLTIYNLGQSIVTGTVTGHDSNDNILYIDGESYEYTLLPWVTNDDRTDLMDNGNDPLGTDGAFYLGKDGKIIGYDGTQGGSYNYGFIVDAYYNASGFEPQWQLKVLTVDDGIVSYNVDTKCDINNVSCDLSTNVSSQDVFGSRTQGVSNKYINAEGVPVTNRVIDFELNKNGEIDEIKFVQVGNPVMANVRAHSIVIASDEYKASTNKLGNKAIEDTLVIFNVKTPDILDATVLDASSLVDEGVYGGLMLDVNNDKEFDIFVMQDGVAAFDAEANFFVVESVASTTYGEDGEDAKLVNYYVEGSDELLQAYITDDSYNALEITGKTYVYNKNSLAKGSIFVANVSESGLVSEYAVVAVIDNETVIDSDTGVYDFNYDSTAYPTGTNDLEVLTEDIYGTNEVDQTGNKGDKTEFVYGYITNISGKTLTLGGTIAVENNKYLAKNVTGGRDFSIGGGVAQYCYNMDNMSKHRVVAGDYRSRNVDVFVNTDTVGNQTIPAKANLVLLKVYDDEVTDIISISDRKTVANNGDDLGILAQTHFGSYNNNNNNAELSAVETVVDVKNEEIVVEEEIIFE